MEELPDERESAALGRRLLVAAGLTSKDVSPEEKPDDKFEFNLE